MGAIKPFYTLMEQHYEKYRVDRKPCKYGYSNQCAIRVSLALSNCGFTYEEFVDQDRIHQGRPKCKLDDLPHIVGAEELKIFLEKVWGTWEFGKPLEMKEKIKGKRGIVYFNNCFRRKKSDTSLKGDHIDLWTGEKYYNQVLAIGAGGDAGTKTDLFSRASYVSFFWLH